MIGQSQFKSGNNIYPAVPELSTILHSPHFAGAVESILGEEYVLHAHRALHVAKIDQSFHQDTPEGHGPYRLHRPKFIMVMYYPYGSTFEMGPTAILPNGSYLQVNPDERVALGKSQGKLLGLTETKLNTLKTGQAFDDSPETTVVVDTKEEPAPTVSVTSSDEDDDTMSYFEKLAEEG